MGNTYLSERTQFLRMGEYSSRYLNINCGAPQGSIYFILYINDLCKVSSILKPTLFTDDTNLFCSGLDLQTLIQDVTTDFNKIKLWFNINKLSLNMNKTKFMYFGNRANNAEITISMYVTNII